MSLSERHAPISEHAGQCLVSFGQCLKSTVSFDGQRYLNIQDEMARFSIWASNMAVFSDGGDCMDHRVRKASEVQRLVLSVLETLRRWIEELKFSTSTQGEFERIANGISSKVSLLHELSNTIRKASRESQDIKAMSSFQLMDEGMNIEDFLKGRFTHYLQDRFGESTDAIRNRLATTMVMRWKRVKFRRLRYSRNPIWPSQPAGKPSIEIPRPEVTEPTTTPRTYSTVQTATTLVPRNFQKASALSSVSCVRSVDVKKLCFPPRPEALSLGVTEVTCQYCLYVLPVSEISDEAKWQSHIVNDLDAYVCLFDPCDEPNTLYRHSKDWLLHMRLQHPY
ncbi:hypothetical protein F5B19DRAFT_342151 [Rostrohypoxylon terebratum]|nr:hypothetical protein F5B19DRAFT_342151 [Rostrohypoxylon terebratum]